MVATDLRVERSKRLLTDAMIDLVLEKDFDAITVQEICDRADVVKHTFYRHFKDKTALMYAALEVTYRELAVYLAEIRDDMRRPIALKTLFDVVGQQPERYRVLMQGAGRTEFHQYTRRMLAYYMLVQLQRVNPGSDAPLEFVARIASGVILETLLWWLESGMPHSTDYMINLVQRLLAFGVLGTFGVKMPDPNFNAAHS